MVTDMKRSSVMVAGVLVLLSCVIDGIPVVGATDIQLHIGAGSGLLKRGLTALSEMASSAKGVVGEWSGSYLCSGRWRGLSLDISGTAPNLNAVARFSWQGIDKGVTGAYQLHGTYDEFTHTLTLNPERWLAQPSGFAMVGMRGVVSGTTLNGRMFPSCQSFQLARETTAPVVSESTSKAAVAKRSVSNGVSSEGAAGARLSEAPDIVGLRLGMPLKSAIAAIETHNPDMHITERTAVIDNVAATKYVNYVAASDGKVLRVGPHAAIGIEFAPPPSKRDAVFVDRFLGFAQNREPLEAATEKALTAKYGRPSYVLRIGPDIYMYWAYSPDGVKLFGRGTRRQCGGVAVLDPTSNFGSLVFSKLASHDCGVTVAAVMERNEVGASAPLQLGDQILYLFMYLIDDSRFAPLSASANSYAREVLHKEGAKVAVPKF